MMDPRLMIAAALVVTSFAGGWKVQGWRMEAEISDIYQNLQLARDIAEKNRKDKEAAVSHATRLAMVMETEKLKKFRVVEKFVDREVIKYVQTAAATECPLDPGWVRIHDAAASGRVPEAAADPGAPDGGATGASRAEVLEVVTINYKAYHHLKVRYMTLLDFTKGLYAEAESG